MTKDEFQEKIKNIGLCEDETERLTMLAELSEEGSKTFDDNETLTASNKEYEESNEKLRAANMKLFLQVGEQKSPEDITKGKTGSEPEPNKKREFKDLFNEKGGIK